MDGTAVRDEAAPLAEEARLARAAAAGDGGAFAVLCGCYEQRAFNLAYRIAGSESEAADAVQQAFLEVMRRAPRLGDGEPSFASHLFAATRNACHEPVGGRQRPRPSEAIGESIASRGENEAIVESTGPRGEGEPEEEAIREASLRLPEHQREALALRELEELSYDEIATIMETSPNSVAQLISRARINLHDELHGNVLASVAAPSPECERALPLIAMREDGQLEAASRDASWLDAHLADCHRCEIGVEVMREASISYRAWAPIAATPGLLKATMAKAAELTGADWSEEIAEAEPARDRPPRRRATLAAGLAALLLLAGAAAAVFAGDDPPAAPVEPAAGSAQGPSAASSGPGANAAKTGERERGAARKKKARRTGAGATAAGTAPAVTTAGETIPAPTSVQATAGGGAPSDSQSRPNRSSGKTAVQPTQPTSTSRPRSKPKPTAASAPAPDPAPTPVAEDPFPAEESPGKSSGKGNPPGKPADRPPK